MIFIYQCIVYVHIKVEYILKVLSIECILRMSFIGSIYKNFGEIKISKDDFKKMISKKLLCLNVSTCSDYYLWSLESGGHGLTTPALHQCWPYQHKVSTMGPICFKSQCAMELSILLEIINKFLLINIFLEINF